MVELLVVAVIMLGLLTMSAPLVTALRSEIALARTNRQVKSDIITGLGYAVSGKSVAALSAGDMMNPGLIPSQYALFFKSAPDYGADNSYYYIEAATSIGATGERQTKQIYQTAKELPSPGIYLKSIRIKRGADDAGQTVASATIFFSPPFARITLVPGMERLVNDTAYSFDEHTVFNESAQNKIIELTYQFKDEEPHTTSLSFNTDKIINVL
jgi:hypothetical protein